MWYFDFPISDIFGFLVNWLRIWEKKSDILEDILRRYIILQCPRFLVCKMRLIIVPIHRLIVTINEINTDKVRDKGRVEGGRLCLLLQVVTKL